MRSAVDREKLNLAAHNLLRRLARRWGLDLVRADFNSPIVATKSVPEDVWNTPLHIPGMDLDLDAQRDMIETTLTGLFDELDIPVRGEDPTVLALHNRWYGPMDVHSLYAMIRRAQPSAVLELGSGQSSLVIDRALEVNDRETGPARHTIVDPFPSPSLRHLRRRAEVCRESAAAAASKFAELKPGDVLFVDTTHVVRPGGEVVRLVLEVLPGLPAGVLVHFHDIYLPYPYPRVLYDRYNVHWQEQYLLAAQLASSPGYAVILSNHALWRAHADWAKATFRGLEDGMAPSAFWFARSSETTA